MKSESLEEARERVALQMCTWNHGRIGQCANCVDHAAVLRELQRQAMEAIVLAERMHDSTEGVLIDRRIDALLDGPAPEEG